MGAGNELLLEATCIGVNVSGRAPGTWAVVLREGMVIRVLSSTRLMSAGMEVTCCGRIGVIVDTGSVGEAPVRCDTCWGWGVCDCICLSTLGREEVWVEGGAAARRAGALGANLFPDLSIEGSVWAVHFEEDTY